MGNSFRDAQPRKSAHVKATQAGRQPAKTIYATIEQQQTDNMAAPHGEKKFRNR